MVPLILSVALAFSPADARISFETARDLVAACTPRDAGTIRGRIAANRLLDAASASGADVRRDVFRAPTPNGDREFTNLYAQFKSDDPEARWVILVSHYDTKPGVSCPGANDGASTSGLLVGIANAFANWETPRGNLFLVWTDGEECMNSYSENDGLWGSRRAAEYVAQHGMQVQAVVCLDMLGDRDLSISIPSNGSPALAKIAVAAARRVGLQGLVAISPDIVKDDHVPFLERGYKAINMIDFSYGPGNSYWHTPADTIDKISESSLLASGRLVAEMLNILL